MRSPVGAPDDGEVWAVVGKFGFTPGLCESWLGVRGADRDVEGRERVAEGEGEDVGGSEVGARNEARNLRLCSAITGLSRSMHKCGDRVVAASKVQQMAWAAPVSRDPDWQAAQGTGSHQHSSMMRIEAPHPCVISLCVTKFQQSRMSPTRSLLLVHLTQLLMDARVHAPVDERLDLHAFAR